MATITPDPANPQGAINIDDFKSPSEVTAAGALQLIVKDAQNSEAWLQQNYWSLRWREADALYQAPPGIIMWEGTTVPRSNVNRFTVAETVNSIKPQILNGLFYEDPAFVLRPRPSQDQNTVRATTALLAIQLEEMKMSKETDLGLDSALLFGTGIWKWGFKSYSKKLKKFVRNAPPVKIKSTIAGQADALIETPESMKFKRVIEDKQIHTPTIENCDIRFVLVDPGCKTPDIRDAKFVIHRMYMTYRDLIKLKDEQFYDENGVLKNRYDLPSEKEVRDWFAPPQETVEHPGSDASLTLGTTLIHHAKAEYMETTVDPLNQPLEVLERWDNDKVITCIQRKKVIRNEANEFGIIPFLSINWWNIPSAFWGLGLGRTIGVEQRVQAGLINACLDLASLIVNPMFVRSRGANIQEQQIRQRIGGIIAVDGPIKEAFQMLEQPTIQGEILQQISMSEGRVEKTSGANQQLTMGASAGSGKGQLGRSGTGAGAIIQANMNRIGGFAELFVRQVYEPLLYQMHEMNRDKLPIPYILSVLGDKLGPAFKFDPEDFKNAPAEFEVLAGSHLAAKSQMAQSLFLMLQTFESPAMMDQLNKISNKKVNIEELFHMIHDMSGFKNYYNIIQDLTPDEQQRQAAQSPAAVAQAQAGVKMKLSDQKFQQNQQLVDQDNEARLVRDVFRQIAEKNIEPEVLTGSPGGVGAGNPSQETA